MEKVERELLEATKQKKRAPRCFVWVDLGDLSPKPPGIYRFET